MTRQKFKRGNLVHIAKDLGESMSHFTADKDAIILYSSAEKYSGKAWNQYGVIFPDNGGESAWYYEQQLTFIEEGGEHLIDAALKVREDNVKLNQDIDYIISKLDEGDLSVTSILVLFDLLGHDTSFKRNGEYYVLFCDWQTLRPVFQYIKNAKSLEDAESIFKEEYRNKYNIKLVYETLNKIKPSI